MWRFRSLCPMRRSCSLLRMHLCCRKSLLHRRASCRRNNNRLCCRRSYSVCPTAFRLHHRRTTATFSHKYKTQISIYNYHGKKYIYNNAHYSSWYTCFEKDRNSLLFGIYLFILIVLIQT